MKSTSLLFAAPLFFLSCNQAPVSVPSEVGRGQKDLANPLLAVSGIYPDGWMSASNSLALSQPPGSMVFHIRGMIPQIADPGFHTTVELRLDDQPIALRKLGLGSVDLSIPVPEGSRTHRVTVGFSRTEVLPGGDGRRVGARLESAGFEKQDRSQVTLPADIAIDPRIHLGSEWGPFESFGGETFRWVDNDAQLSLDLAPAHDAVVTLMVEPGPNAGGRPFLLRILDESGHQAGAILLDRRGIFRLPLPLKGTGASVFSLHADLGGASIAKESRVLNFRIFAIDAESLP
jgi:hypothetical protein